MHCEQPTVSSRVSTGLALPEAVLSFLPRAARPSVLVALLMTWELLELGCRILVGDTSWLTAHPVVPLEPRARAAALSLLLGSSAPPDSGPSRWVVPLWRFLEETPPRDRRPDLMDLASRISGPWCMHPPLESGEDPLLRASRQFARTVWIARHWTVDEVIGRWGECVAEPLARCGEAVPRPRSPAEMVHLWAHEVDSPWCGASVAGWRWQVGLATVARDQPGLRVEDLEPPASCRGRHWFRQTR